MDAYGALVALGEETEALAAVLRTLNPPQFGPSGLTVGTVQRGRLLPPPGTQDQRLPAAQCGSNQATVPPAARRDLAGTMV